MHGCNRDSELAAYHIGVVSLAVDLVVSYCVAYDVRSYEISLVGVVYLHAVLIHDVAICIADIKRIYRAHVVCDVEYVG